MPEIPGPATPAVSVIIPAFNVAPYIRETLDSVFAQTFRDFEVILVNDGSPDTEALEQAIREYLPRIVYFEQPNAGASAARNAAIRAAHGKYLAFLDGDDAWAPEYLATQVAELASRPELDLVYCDALLFGDSPFAGSTYMELNPSGGPATLEALVAARCVPLTSCTVVRREAVIAAGMFDTTLTRAEDFDLWLRLADRGRKLGYHRAVLGRRRLREDSLTSTQVLCYGSIIRILDKLAAQPGISSELRGEIARQIAAQQSAMCICTGKDLLAKGSYPEAIELFQKANAIRRDPKLRAILALIDLNPAAARAFTRAWNRYLNARAERKYRKLKFRTCPETSSSETRSAFSTRG